MTYLIFQTHLVQMTGVISHPDAINHPGGIDHRFGLGSLVIGEERDIDIIKGDGIGVVHVQLQGLVINRLQN